MLLLLLLSFTLVRTIEAASLSALRIHSINTVIMVCAPI